MSGAMRSASLVSDVDRAARAGRLRNPAAFIAESCPERRRTDHSSAWLPGGGLRARARRRRRLHRRRSADRRTAGIGTHFYAFEAQDVVPDIVVLGKPIGNGYPLGAVVTTPEIAASFDNGMEFFSTFGGNTVSCAVGLAVLDVSRTNELQAHARDVGDDLLARLAAAGRSHRARRRRPRFGSVPRRRAGARSRDARAGAGGGVRRRQSYARGGDSASAPTVRSQRPEDPPADAVYAGRRRAAVPSARSCPGRARLTPRCAGCTCSSSKIRPGFRLASARAS